MSGITGRCARTVAGAMLLLAWAATALAAPQGMHHVIIVDCTGTMKYQGRAQATLAALQEFVKAMAPEDRVSVYGYGERTHAVLSKYPVTVGDAAARQSLMNAMRLTFDHDRTDITAGLELAWRERDKVLPVIGGRRNGCVVLLTDGKLIPVYEDYSQYDAIRAASEARLRELGRMFGEIRVPVVTIGLGRPDQVDGALLADVSTASGGEYFASLDAQALSGAFSKAAVKAAARRPSENEAVADAAPAADAPREATAQPSDGGKNTKAQEPRPADAPRSGGLVKGMLAAAGDCRARSSMFYQGATAALGVLMGVVALGVHRKQSWTNVFTRAIGTQPARVKGYLRPVEREGTTSARACVPLENPGHVCVRLGAGGDFLDDLAHTAVEVIGTRDDGGPLIRVVTGSVTVNGEPVRTMRKLADGDALDIDGRPFVYLRGRRR